MFLCLLTNAVPTTHVRIYLLVFIIDGDHKEICMCGLTVLTITIGGNIMLLWITNHIATNMFSELKTSETLCP